MTKKMWLLRIAFHDFSECDLSFFLFLLCYAQKVPYLCVFHNRWQNQDLHEKFRKTNHSIIEKILLIIWKKCFWWKLYLTSKL
mmetsp:Transcript_10584/g.13737  ORF Transcript_10584/g.13737 Transcript_10584/m.13737 type:complete len:83 (-) Transcript_10584:124-372(-)